jgi:hypothetical protein
MCKIVNKELAMVFLGALNRERNVSEPIIGVIDKPQYIIRVCGPH